MNEKKLNKKTYAITGFRIIQQFRDDILYETLNGDGKRNGNPDQNVPTFFWRTWKLKNDKTWRKTERKHKDKDKKR